VEAAIAGGRTMYGINTASESSPTSAIPPDKLEQLQANLIRSHAAVSATRSARRGPRLMLLRANVLLGPPAVCGRRWWMPWSGC